MALGEGVAGFAIGDRVAWVYAPGSYAEQVEVPEGALVRVPDAIDNRTAAAIMMQGLTASHFATDFYPVQPGDVALVHAAARVDIGGHRFGGQRPALAEGNNHEKVRI